MPQQLTVPFTEYKTRDDVEVVHHLPAKYAICPDCEGCGTDRGRSVECDGGGFTASEWRDEDPDFKDAYLAGEYDRPCESCRQTPGRILVVDRNRADPALLALFDAQQRDNAEFEALSRAERRAGA